MLLSNKSTNKFEMDTCQLVHKSLTLASFRIPKKKPTKKPILKRLVRAAIEVEEANGEPAPTPALVLTIEAIHMCFTKSKMLRTDE